jgi:HEAT repeat protein
MVLPILADIGDQESRPTLTDLTRDTDQAVAEAAREGLRVLDARLAGQGT